MDLKKTQVALIKSTAKTMLEGIYKDVSELVLKNTEKVLLDNPDINVGKMLKDRDILKIIVVDCLRQEILKYGAIQALDQLKKLFEDKGDDTYGKPAGK